jgi:hypothetical protein
MNPRLPRARLVLVLVVAAGGPAASQQPGDCTVLATPPTRVALDGRSLHIANPAIAAAGGQTFVAGRTVLLTGSGSAITGVTRDSVLGAVISPTGAVVGIPQPILGRIAFYPRVVAAGDGEWHVVFYTELGPSTQPNKADSADVWYGRYTTAGWRDVARIQRADSANLFGDASPDLIENRGELFFAYSIRILTFAGRPLIEKYGVVMLRRGGAAWTADTVITESDITKLRLVRRDDGPGVDVVFKQGVFESGRWFGSSAVLYRYGSAWSPRQILSETPTLGSPELIVAGENRAVVWLGADDGIMRWAESRPVANGVIVDSGSVPMGPVMDFSPARMGSHFLVLGRPKERNDPLQIAIRTSAGWRAANTLAIDANVPLFYARGTSDSTAILFTTRLARDSTESPFELRYQRLTTRCSSSGGVTDVPLAGRGQKRTGLQRR